MQLMTIDARTLRLNLFKYLRGTAHTWYISQLTPEQRAVLFEGPEINNWKTILLRKYQVPQEEAWRKLQAMEYNEEDIKSNRPPAEFVLSVMQLAQAGGTTGVSA